MTEIGHNHGHCSFVSCVICGIFHFVASYCSKYKSFCLSSLNVFRMDKLNLTVDFSEEPVILIKFELFK